MEKNTIIMGLFAIAVSLIVSSIDFFTRHIASLYSDVILGLLFLILGGIILLFITKFTGKIK